MNERVTVELDSETLKRAREAGLDLSELLTQAVRRELPPHRKQDAQTWYAENKEEVDSYNEFISKHGLFSDGIRKF